MAWYLSLDGPQEAPARGLQSQQKQERGAGDDPFQPIPAAWPIP